MRISIPILLALTLVFAAGPARAATTEWQDLGGGKARLVAQMDPSTGRVEGVVQFSLDPGWKTYWREPGGSGIPPVFDFSASRGFAAGEASFPVPSSLSAGGSRFAGYSGEVAFPFVGEALAGNGAIVLDLMAGVCEEICIPATARFELPLELLNVSDARAALEIAQARQMLPGEPREGMRVAHARFTRAGGLLVEAELAAGEPAPQLFVEGPHGWYFSQARLVAAQDGKARFDVPLAGRPQGAGTLRLVFTLAVGGAGIEQAMEVEAPEAK